jgi:hypothetical protein
MLLMQCRYFALEGAGFSGQVQSEIGVTEHCPNRRS